MTLRPSPLNILSVAYPFAPVTADPVGGAEQVLAHLDRALAADGHRSRVIACAGSTVAGELIALPAPPAQIDEPARAATHAAVRAALAAELAREPADLVHLHGIDFHAYLPPPGPPALATLHLPLAWYPSHALAPTRPNTHLNPVSQSQAASAPPGARLLPPVPNGVDTASFARPRAKRNFALILARICPEKGIAQAIEAATRARIPLLIAGALFPYAEHQRYFAEQVRPHLSRTIRWLGPVTGAPKRHLLASARCLLVPSLAPETSSLVAMEALASGTPVIAFPAGALPEIVDHGRTGFITPDVAAMAAAMGQAHTIDPETCRAEARARFELTRATRAYVDLYARLVAACVA